MKLYITDCGMGDSLIDQYRRDLDYIHNILTRLNIDWHYHDLPEMDQYYNFVLKPIEEDCVLIMSYDNKIFTLEDYMLETWLDNFFKYNSYLVVANPSGVESSNWLYDFFIVKTKNYFNVFKKYSDRIFFYYGDMIEPSHQYLLEQFNFIQTHRSAWINILPSFMNNSYEKRKRTDQFLITTIVRNRPHRQLLQKEFVNQRVENYIGNFHATRKDAQTNWAGKHNIGHHWVDGDIAWDLYDRVSFEVVPETHFEFVTHVTEKTYKPMIARIPFLVLSNPMFYTDLKNLGFKTFSSLIDESFAEHEILSRRVNGLINTVKDIQKNGALEFYYAAKEICDYNFDHCYYLAGKEKYSHYINSIALDKYIKDFNFKIKK